MTNFMTRLAREKMCDSYSNYSSSRSSSSRRSSSRRSSSNRSDNASKAVTTYSPLNYSSFSNSSSRAVAKYGSIRATVNHFEECTRNGVEITFNDERNGIVLRQPKYCRCGTAISNHFYDCKCSVSSYEYLLPLTWNQIVVNVVKAIITRPCILGRLR